MESKENLLNFLNNWLENYISEQLNDLINLIKLENKNQYIRLALDFMKIMGFLNERN